MGAWLWINWGGGEWSCVSECWQHCNVKCQILSFYHVFSVPAQLAPLSCNITWARRSDSQNHLVWKGLMCHHKKQCSAHSCAVWQKCDSIHVFGTIFSLTHIHQPDLFINLTPSSTWPLHWASIHWKDMVLKCLIKTGGQKSGMFRLHILNGYLRSVTPNSVTAHTEWLPEVCHP